MRRNKIVKTVLGLVAIIAMAGTAFGYSGSVARAEDAQPTAAQPFALTPAPSNAPFSAFDPKHKFLGNGLSSITASKGKVTVNATTTANQVVDSIGITFYVQKWNGSSWDNVGSGSTSGDNSISYYSTTFSKTVDAGYYYRARTIHWIIHNGVYEDGEVITSSVLGI
ncbi:hypothetical protein [Cohnella terricola]|uniref:Uncharacterized protein n=1 Tax=Cohnella terricola TaxID=1289167 RepID=A0A559JMR0_9BACL|nr:hypothetical protein [Cohnella terricola]TVY01162.1 hypothetical protein FPZ45_08390 [Cohnella terricola]